jgi:CTP synthase
VISKISSFTNVPKDMVVSSLNVSWKYKVVQSLREQNMDGKVLEKLGCLEQYSKIDFSKWDNLYHLHDKVGTFTKVKLAFVRKYVVNIDNYVSLLEALNHAALLAHIDLQIEFVNAEDEGLIDNLMTCDAIIIPGGFGPRGTEGMVSSCRYARENGVPFLGICLGFQISVIEVARSLLKLPRANSTEMDQQTPDPVIDQLSKQYASIRGLTTDFSLTKEGIRLGAMALTLKEGSRLAQIYKTTDISERFRNRYVLNPKYVEAMEEVGARFTAFSHFQDVPTGESLEFPDHPFYVSVQFHPEFKSKIFSPHPLISTFLQVAANKKREAESKKG